jgi:hypothetical protein
MTNFMLGVIFHAFPRFMLRPAISISDFFELAGFRLHYIDQARFSTSAPEYADAATMVRGSHRFKRAKSRAALPKARTRRIGCPRIASRQVSDESGFLPR